MRAYDILLLLERSAISPDNACLLSHYLYDADAMSARSDDRSSRQPQVFGCQQHSKVVKSGLRLNLGFVASADVYDLTQPLILIVRRDSPKDVCSPLGCVL